MSPQTLVRSAKVRFFPAQNSSLLPLEELIVILRLFGTAVHRLQEEVKIWSTTTACLSLQKNKMKEKENSNRLKPVQEPTKITPRLQILLYSCDVMLLKLVYCSLANWRQESGQVWAVVVVTTTDGESPN